MKESGKKHPQSPFLELHCFAFRKGVTHFVVLCPDMPFNPFEGEAVGRHDTVQGFPEVLIGDGGLGGGEPAVAFPVVEPAVGDGFLEVLAVGVEGDGAADAVIQELQCFVGGAELHTVVRRGGLAAGEGEELAALGSEEDGGKSAGPIGVHEAGAVGVDDECLGKDDALGLAVVGDAADVHGFGVGGVFLLECFDRWCGLSGDGRMGNGFRRRGDGLAVPGLCFGLGGKAFVDGSGKSGDFFLAVAPAVVDARMVSALDDVVFLGHGVPFGEMESGGKGGAAPFSVS